MLTFSPHDSPATVPRPAESTVATRVDSLDQSSSPLARDGRANEDLTFAGQSGRPHPSPLLCSISSSSSIHHFGARRPRLRLSPTPPAILPSQRFVFFRLTILAGNHQHDRHKLQRSFNFAQLRPFSTRILALPFARTAARLPSSVTDRRLLSIGFRALTAGRPRSTYSTSSPPARASAEGSTPSLARHGSGSAHTTFAAGDSRGGTLDLSRSRTGDAESSGHDSENLGQGEARVGEEEEGDREGLVLSSCFVVVDVLQCLCAAFVVSGAKWRVKSRRMFGERERFARAPRRESEQLRRYRNAAASFGTVKCRSNCLHHPLFLLHRRVFPRTLRCSRLSSPLNSPDFNLAQDGQIEEEQGQEVRRASPAACLAL